MNLFEKLKKSWFIFVIIFGLSAIFALTCSARNKKKDAAQPSPKTGTPNGSSKASPITIEVSTLEHKDDKNKGEDPGCRSNTVISISTDHENGIYKIKEKAQFLIAVKRDSFPIKEGQIEYVLSDDGGKKLKTEKIPINQKIIKLDASLNRPGVLRLDVTYRGKCSEVSFRSAVVFNPYQLKAEYSRPHDFMEYWKRQKARLQGIPINPKLEIASEHSNNDEKVYRVILDNFGGTKVHGWLCLPNRTGKFPALIEFPSAGVYPIEPFRYCSGVGMIFFVMSIHNIAVNAPQSKYDSLSESGLSNYVYHGKDSPDTYYFNRVLLGISRSIEFVATRGEWDQKNLGVTGGSQGGGLALIAAGLDERITAVAASVPGLADLQGSLHGRSGGWPKGLIKNSSDLKAIKTASYYDAIFFAQNIKAQALVALGLVDDICSPSSILMAYNAINVKHKKLIIDPKGGHDGVENWLELREKFLVNAMKKNN